ncbi:LysM peptidoglycan-binding domain-containing protein [Oceaniglobus trochenteri]|uniref:LysM peptidoglycan-binding domain-containing protein n=1 Tax=Oceaniglobus trochenteri TaxID=2763260 RepID=UPI00247AF621|nr:LysM peptidoglycan-binding domain-containing protein [Oceaniglobus trochenteri]
MINLSGMGASGGAIVGAAAIAGVAVLGYFALRPEPALPPPSVVPDVVAVVPPAPANDAPQPTPPKAPAPPSRGEGAPPAPPPAGDAPEVEGAAPVPEPAPPPQQGHPAPSFDIVRVEPDGSALIAGRAAPGSTVSVLLDGDEIATEQVDGQGGFVALVTIEPSAVPRILSLSSRLGDSVLVAQQTVILAPSAETLLAAAPAEAAPQPPAPAAALPDAPPARAVATPPQAQTPAPAEERGAEEADGPVPPEETTAPETAMQTAEADAATADDPEADGATPPAVDGTAPGDLALADPTTEQPRRPGANTPPAIRATPGAPGRPATSQPEPVARATPPGQPGMASAPTAPTIAQPGEAPGTLPDAAAPASPAPAPAPPRVLVADDSGMKVLQEPGPGPDAMSSVSLDTISYDASGDVVLGGRGGPSRFVRVYLDNDPVRTTRIGEDGQWRADLPRIDTRVYTLRVDEIEEGGDVVSRTETPFRPEAPETVIAAETASPDAPPVTVVTVQPGFTLWRIARENYGDGILYVRVFEANADKIRDPDLIYPGQIFTVPE